MTKRLLHWFGFCCCLILAIAAVQTFAMSATPDLIQPLPIRPYALSQCLTPIRPMDRETGVVIQDEQTLQSRWVNSSDCKTEGKQNLDFSQYTLLGRAFSIPGGCSRGGNGFTLSLTQDKQRRLYTHTITHGTGPCAGHSVHEIWVLAPKLPPAYRVEFQHIRQSGLLVTCGYEDEW